MCAWHSAGRTCVGLLRVPRVHQIAAGRRGAGAHSALYAIEAEIRGHPAEHRRQVRQERSRPIVEALHAWLQDHLLACPRCSDLAKAIRYAIRHWPGLVVFLEDGRVEMDTNVVERAIRPHTLTRKNALFAGSDGGARHWAIAMTLIQTAKLNGVEPMAWLTDVLERVVSGGTKANHCISCSHGTGKPAPMQCRAPHSASDGRMIDHPEITERLIAKLNAALPIPARLTPELQALLRRRTPARRSRARQITWISYAGDEGGIVCKLDFGPDIENAAFVHHPPALRCPLAAGTRNRRLSKAPRQTPPAPSKVASPHAAPSSKT